MSNESLKPLGDLLLDPMKVLDALAVAAAEHAAENAPRLTQRELFLIQAYTRRGEEIDADNPATLEKKIAVDNFITASLQAENKDPGLRPGDEERSSRPI